MSIDEICNKGQELDAEAIATGNRADLWKLEAFAGEHFAEVARELAALRAQLSQANAERDGFRAFTKEIGWEEAIGTSHLEYLKDVSEEEFSWLRLHEMKIQNDELRAERDKLKARVHGDEHSEDCPFCATYPATGHAQQCPMCRLCTMESNRDSILAAANSRNAKLESAIKWIESDLNADASSEWVRQSILARIAELKETK